MLVTTWFDDPHRPTRDLELHCYGDSSAEAMLITGKEICATAIDDGISFDSESLRVDPIREELEYGGLRIRTTAAMARARISITVDIGFVDAVEPGVEEIDLPVLLDLPAPRLRAYARETVIAEKYQAMVALGLASSRMKDFYDVWALSKTHTFDNRLAQAIAATFKRRNTVIPEALPDAFTPEFFRNEGFSVNGAAESMYVAPEVLISLSSRIKMLRTVISLQATTLAVAPRHPRGPRSPDSTRGACPPARNPSNDKGAQPPCWKV